MSLANKIEQPYSVLDFTSMGSDSFGPGIPLPDLDLRAAASGGDLTFARSNYLLQSQTIATGAVKTAPWVTVGTSPSFLADQAIAPDGTVTADLIGLSATPTVNDICAIRQPFTCTMAPWTCSVWMRTDSGTTNVSLILADNGIGSTTVNCAITTTWQRFSVTRTMVSTSANVTIGYYLVINPAASVYIWGAQVSATSIPMPYRATTNAQYLGAAGTATTLSAPFVQSDATTWTNVTLRSEEASYWAVGRTTVAVNTAIAPDGSFSADKMVDDANNGTHYLSASASFAGTAAPWTTSVYVKPSGRTFASLSVDGGTNGCTFDLTAGTVGTAIGTGAGAIQALSNGWFRISVTQTMTAAPYTPRLAMGIADQNCFAVGYQGDSASGMYVWGWQTTLGSKASPHVPTTTVATTGGLNGGVGKTVTNLCLQSENLASFPTWTLSANTVLANQIAAPDGTITADLMKENSTVIPKKF